MLACGLCEFSNFSSFFGKVVGVFVEVFLESGRVGRCCSACAVRDGSSIGEHTV